MAATVRCRTLVSVICLVLLIHEAVAPRVHSSRKGGLSRRIRPFRARAQQAKPDGDSEGLQTSTTQRYRLLRGHCRPVQIYCLSLLFLNSWKMQLFIFFQLFQNIVKSGFSAGSIEDVFYSVCDVKLILLLSTYQVHKVLVYGLK